MSLEWCFFVGMIDSGSLDACPSKKKGISRIGDGRRFSVLVEFLLVPFSVPVEFLLVPFSVPVNFLLVPTTNPRYQ